MSLLKIPLEILYIILEHGHIFDHVTLSKTCHYLNSRINQYYHYKLKIKRDYDPDVNYKLIDYESMDIQFTKFLFDEYNMMPEFYRECVDIQELTIRINHCLHNIVNDILTKYNTSDFSKAKDSHDYIDILCDIVKVDEDNDFIDNIFGVKDILTTEMKYVIDSYIYDIHTHFEDYVSYIINHDHKQSCADIFTYNSLYKDRIKLLKLDVDKFEKLLY